MNKIKAFIDNNKILLALTLLVIFTSNVLVLINVLTGLQGDYANRFLVIVAIAIFLIHQILSIISKIKNKDTISILINIAILVLLIALGVKYFQDEPRYFKHNNRTNLFLIIIVSLKFIFITVNNIFNKKVNNINKVILPMLLVVTLIVFSFIEVTNTNVLTFYKLLIWLSITLIAFLYLNIIAINKNYFFTKYFIVLLSITLVYHLFSFILVATGHYKYSVFKTINEFVVFNYLLIYIFNLKVKNNMFAKKNIANILLFLGYITGLITIFIIGPKYNIFLLLFQLLILSTIINKAITTNFAKKYPKFIIGISIISLISILASLISFNKVNLTLFMAFLLTTSLISLVITIANFKYTLYNKDNLNEVNLASII